MNRMVAVVAGGVVLLIVVGFGAITFMKKGKPEVKLILNASGADCRIQMPDVVGERHGKKVKWTITNNCSSGQLVRLSDFKRRHLIGDGYDAFDNAVVSPYPPTSQLIGPGGTAALDATLDKGVKYWPLIDTYKYTICVGPDASNLTNCIDPDVEVWP